jgi:hypothetical protein
VIDRVLRGLWIRFADVEEAAVAEAGCDVPRRERVGFEVKGAWVGFPKVEQAAIADVWRMAMWFRLAWVL